MSERRVAIPNLIVFICGLILGLWFAVPSPADISLIILETLARAIQPLNIEQADRMVGMYIILFRIFGIVLIVLDVLGVYIQLKKEA